MLGIAVCGKGKVATDLFKGKVHKNGDKKNFGFANYSVDMSVLSTSINKPRKSN